MPILRSEMLVLEEALIRFTFDTLDYLPCSCNSSVSEEFFCWQLKVFNLCHSIHSLFLEQENFSLKSNLNFLLFRKKKKREKFAPHFTFSMCRRVCPFLLISNKNNQLFHQHRSLYQAWFNQDLKDQHIFTIFKTRLLFLIFLMLHQHRILIS